VYFYRPAQREASALGQSLLKAFSPDAFGFSHFPVPGARQSWRKCSAQFESRTPTRGVIRISSGIAADVAAPAIFEIDCSGTVDDEMRDVLPLSMRSELTLYSRAMCSWCIDAKDFLQSRGYKFTEIDVGRNRAAYEEMKELSDQAYVPTLVAGEEVLANFDVEQLEKFLDDHRIEP
jgi:glutaredoxin 3